MNSEYLSEGLGLCPKPRKGLRPLTRVVSGGIIIGYNIAFHFHKLTKHFNYAEGILLNQHQADSDIN